MNGWQGVNGWEALRQAIGRIPDLVEHWLSLTLEVPASDGVTPASATASAIVESDAAELWTLATWAAGFPTAAPATAQLGQSADVYPDFYPAVVDVQTEDGGQRLSDQPVFLGHLFGGGFRLPATAPQTVFSPTVEFDPHVLPAPWILPGGSTVRATISSLDTTARTVHLTFCGFKRLRHSPPVPVDVFLSAQLLTSLDILGARNELERVEPFYYCHRYDQTAGRPAFGSEQRTFTVSAGAYLAALQMGQVIDPDLETFYPSATKPQPAELVRLALDNGAVRLDDGPVSLSAAFGTGRLPFYLQPPLFMGQDTSLTSIVQFNDNSATGNTPLRGWLTWGGVRVLPDTRL